MIGGHDLDAAGITDPDLRSSYERCRRANARHGRTYYLATMLLPPAKRPFVHALYGFARQVDDVVDLPDPTGADPAQRLAALTDRFLRDLAAGTSADPLYRATVDTARRWRIPDEHFTAFLRSMAMDLTVRDYATYDDLYEYMYGSAAAIGLQVTAVLEPLSDRALPYAVDLGIAFQLVNFLRDVGEDLDRGRVYLPADELAAFGVDRDVLSRRVVTPEVRRAFAGQLERVRDLADRSRTGVDLLAPSSRACVDAARTLYCGIADEIERNDYDVFSRRARVPLRRRAGVFARSWWRARRAAQWSEPITPAPPSARP